ncbi:Tyrosine-protein phosphatase Lar-like protein [Escovopsis weberi]|uniref:Tyrosine-protein phosphatase Lar-like protein n=1 Tax=Escovopsis weberi TaxID=150374 RepID=A0A0M8MQV4_ESCWE|nr:Tyrosine-protein phosphatase Lar-like protein [Escovopsis weberi]
MDRIPKFRRKPKPPAIETAIDCNMTVATQSLPVNDASKPPQAPPQLQQQPKPSKIAAFKNLRLRGPAKRARDEPPPAEILPTNPPQTQTQAQTRIQTQTQTKSQTPAAIAQSPNLPRSKIARPIAQSEADKKKKKKKPSDSENTVNSNSISKNHVNSSQTPLKLPKFMTLSNQEMENKYQELTWAERNRIAQGMHNEDAQDCPWTHFKQDDAQIQIKGVMDRYCNIKPWNHNRVRLCVPESELDYVNASTIELKSLSDKTKAPLRYIAMQGPTEPSFDYVWRMIAEQIDSPAVIVQLTSMIESGTVKCDQYFPFEGGQALWSLNESDAWNDGWKAQLTYDSTENLRGGAIEKRKLLLSIEGEAEPRVVWHLLYRRWPDFGVPTLEDIDTFFELMRLSQSLSSPASARVIHCSAGVGRTGTFICLEHLIRELESGALEKHDSPTEGPDLVYDTVDTLRQQRRAMVQGNVQYIFIYQVIRKLWEDKYGAADAESAASRPVAAGS